MIFTKLNAGIGIEHGAETRASSYIIGLFLNCIGLFWEFIGLFLNCIGLFAYCIGLFPMTAGSVLTRAPKNRHRPQ
ncbi:hypothetical protein M3N64_12080 [Sporolactobacillus sp. CPB3-1]|uniref:Uncharacterized protein n=1 Tax=Sporolactobacillus mangiferae TaxID=2940498 RepID=A0ABT0MCP8_9BACL|nr:hypothetical protein [Sporolactobacillus mangiferae]MCL1632657.1 hypothetical protein [Sporolactobacillus mangiferae]